MQILNFELWRVVQTVRLIFHSLVHLSWNKMKTRWRRLTVEGCSSSLFHSPSSPFNLWSVLWRYNSAKSWLLLEDLTFVKEEFYNLLSISAFHFFIIYSVYSCRHLHHSRFSCCGLNSWNLALPKSLSNITGGHVRRRQPFSLCTILLDVASVLQTRQSSLHHLQKFSFLFTWSFDRYILIIIISGSNYNKLLHAFSGLNRVLLQQTCYPNYLETQDFKFSGRCKWSKRISRHLSWGWRRGCERVEQDRLFLYICVSVCVCEYLLNESVCVCVLGCVLFLICVDQTYSECV